jgi:hypothetical protein
MLISVLAAQYAKIFELLAVSMNIIITICRYTLTCRTLPDLYDYVVKFSFDLS